MYLQPSFYCVSCGVWLCDRYIEIEGNGLRKTEVKGLQDEKWIRKIKKGREEEKESE